MIYFYYKYICIYIFFFKKVSIQNLKGIKPTSALVLFFLLNGGKLMILGEPPSKGSSFLPFGIINPKSSILRILLEISHSYTDQGNLESIQWRF